MVGIAVQQREEELGILPDFDLEMSRRCHGVGVQTG